jgi:hypothetical protein
MNLSFPSLNYERDFMFLSSLGMFLIVIGSAFVITLLNSAPEEEFCGIKIAQLGILIILFYLLVGGLTLLTGIVLWWRSDYRKKRKIGDKADKIEEKNRKERIEPSDPDEASVTNESDNFEDKKTLPRNLEKGEKNE